MEKIKKIIGAIMNFVDDLAESALLNPLGCVAGTGGHITEEDIREVQAWLDSICKKEDEDDESKEDAEDKEDKKDDENKGE